MIVDNVMSVANIDDMTNNAVVAAPAVAVVVAGWKAMIPIARRTVRSVEQVPLDINDEYDEPDDEDGSSRLLHATTLMLP